MEILASKSFKFSNFPKARYATDVIFEIANRPAKNIFENKKYFSVKLYFHEFKPKVLVLFNGIAINASAASPGSVSDIMIFQIQLKWHLLADENIHDTEFCKQSTSNAENASTEKQSILLDKEYCGLHSEVSSIIPKKKPINDILTAID